MKFFPYSERALLTLWVGGMWAIGYIVAPILFNVLDDRQLAGMLAGHTFTAISYIGLACGGLLLIGGAYSHGWKHWRHAVLLLMLIIVCVGQFVLQPMMAELKATGIAEGSVAVATFGKLHGVASILFLVNSLAGLVLIVSSAKE
ncbi:DUF4149 domain-containing protein [Sulfuriflexus mobilis]|uniref:DUF4149 domain-containing protein n=1 Tax=Sulfuriflexus mobilis TaxID=1811807 RepID=UPI000F81DDD5|nr:DUF4149 domain-containing protein [Sulfuriflexus mobilis]